MYILLEFVDFGGFEASSLLLSVLGASPPRLVGSLAILLAFGR